MLCPHCQNEFESPNPKAVYCSRTCYQRAKAKRYDSTHPKPYVPVQHTEFHFCKHCHKGFIPNRSDQIYCSKKCSDRAENLRYEKAHPENAMTRKFLAWDGEGEDGKYTLLANSNGEYIEDREKGLSTVRCLDFLVRNGRNRNNVWFAFGYDVSMILKDIPVIDDMGGPSLTRLHKTGHLKYRGFQITYYPKKKFFVTRGKQRFVSYDTFSFFQTKFAKVCQEWVGEVPSLITEGKDAREDFVKWPMERIREYNQLECELLTVLMDKFREALKSAELELSSWHGPGALATSWLKKHDIASHIVEPPFEMKESVFRAYFGGRIEIAGWGHVPHVWHYDINSAYPRALCDVISLASVDWKLKQGSCEDPFTLCHVKWDCAKALKGHMAQWGPLPYRLHDGSILYPPKGEGWYWGIEAQAALRRFPGQVEILEHWYPEGERVYPFRDPIIHDAARRLRWKAEGFPGHVPLKLVLNSLYGKLAQKLGYWNDGKYTKPPYQCHIWAGYVTAFTRAMISDALHMANDRVVCVMTDSVWSLEPLDLEIGKGLGEWSFEEEDKAADFCGAGLYQAYDEAGKVRPKEYKSRGFSPEQGDKLDYSELIQQWIESLDSGDWEGRKFKLRRFIGIGQAVRQPKYRPYYGHFIELERTMENLAMVGQSKRLGNVAVRPKEEGGIFWMPPCPVPIKRQREMWEPEIPLSEPYKIGKAEQDAGEDAMEELAAREDEEY